MPSVKKTIKFNPLEAPVAISKKMEGPSSESKKTAARSPARKKTVTTSSVSKKTVAAKSKPAKQAPTPLETNTPPKEPFKTTDYVIQTSGEHGSAPLLDNGSDFGFEVPELGFISLKSPQMLGQLKNHFLMPRVIGGFVLSGSFGNAVSFILGKPNNKHYFFLLKSSHGKLVFSRFDSPTLAYVINKIYT
jgi:hypothetical protein